MSKSNPRKVPPREIKEVVEQQVHQEVRAQMWRGPIPHPDAIRKMEEIYPGAAGIIFTNLQKQTEHRIEIEKQVISSNIRGERIGQIFAFIIVMTALIGGFWLISIGHQAAGLITAVGSLTAILGVLIFGRSRSKAELQKKTE